MLSRQGSMSSSAGGLIARIRGKSVKDETGKPSTPQSSGSGGLMSRIRGRSLAPSDDSPSGGKKPSVGASRRQGSIVSSGGGSDVMDSTVRDPHLTSKQLQAEEEAKREKIATRAAWEWSDRATLCLHNVVIATQKTSLGQGKALLGDAWELTHVSKSQKTTQTAIEFTDSDGDAIRFHLLPGGKLTISVNGVVRGEPTQFRYDAARKVLLSKPWRIGFDGLLEEDVPRLLGKLAGLFTRANIIHNLPAYDFHDEDSPTAGRRAGAEGQEVKDLKELMRKEKAHLEAAIAKLDAKTEEHTKTAVDLQHKTKKLWQAETKMREYESELDFLKAKMSAERRQLEQVLGKARDGESKIAMSVKDRDTKVQSLQAALDHANLKRKQAEANLEAGQKQIYELQQETLYGSSGDKNQITNLTNELSVALNENVRYQSTVSELEMKVSQMLQSLAIANSRLQDAEDSNRVKAEQIYTLEDGLTKLQQRIGNATDTENLEVARRLAIELEERGKMEYFHLWSRAETRVAVFKERAHRTESNLMSRQEELNRIILTNEERARNEYMNIWLRSELRHSTTTTASSLERAALTSLKHSKALLELKLLRSHGAVAKSFVSPLLGGCPYAIMCRYYMHLRVFAMVNKYRRLATRSSRILERATNRRSQAVAYGKLLFWTSDHSGDRKLAIRAYMQQHPMFYTRETIARMKMEAFEEKHRRQLFVHSHLQLTEQLMRVRMEERQTSELWLRIGLRYIRGPMSGGPEALLKQLAVLKRLLQLEEDKADEAGKANKLLSQQRDHLWRLNTQMSSEVLRVDSLRLLLHQAEQRKGVEVQWALGIVSAMWGMLAPRRRVCDGWMLVSVASWQGGSQWSQKYVWLDQDKGQLLYASKDPRVSAGGTVHSLKLTNIVAVEIEMFSDGMQPPPVNRYQQLGFYVELAKGAKYRFCAATVGERTEWLDNLRKAVLAIWRTSDVHHTMVPSQQQPQLQQTPGRGGSEAPSSPRGSSYRKLKTNVFLSQLPASRDQHPQLRDGSLSPRMSGHPTPHKRGASSAYPGRPPSSAESPRPYREREESIPLEHMSYIGLS
ncbi:hypothetical protein DIPPA_24871 [Diplonema papillatum]|nr:hypothetical protein DIPPA_24871 [Diplonema papillatum]